VPSGDDVRVSASFIGVSGDCLVGDEVAIGLNREPKLAADGREFGETYVAEFRAAQAKIAKAKRETAVGVELSQQPSALRVWCKQFDTGLKYSDPSLVLALRVSLKSVQNGSCRFCRSQRVARDRWREVATDLRALWLRVRKANRNRASGASATRVWRVCAVDAGRPHGAGDPCSVLVRDLGHPRIIPIVPELLSLKAVRDYSRERRWTWISRCIESF
jgi:hypothetical protein